MLLAACASPKPPLSERLPKLQGRALTVVTYEGRKIDVDRREFYEFTGNVFSAAGARSASQKHASAYVMANLRLQDPAPAVADLVQARVTDILKSADVKRLADLAPKGLTFRSTEGLKSAAQNGLVMDVATSSWGLSYLNKDGPAKYMFSYQARARLFDTESKTVVGESWCDYGSTDKPEAAPTYDELMQDDGAVLRKALGDAINSCAEELSTHLLQ